MVSVHVMDSSLAHVLTFLQRLGLCVNDRFERTGDQQCLDWAIALWKLLFDFLPADSPARWMVLHNLANSRSVRYDRWRCMADLERAIVLQRDTITLCPGDHEDRPDLMVHLAMSLSNRFELQSKVEDLDEAVQLRRTALTLFSDDHPGRPASLGNLGVSLATRFEQTGNADDLSESIAIFHALLSFRPEGHSDRALALNNLANALYKRFEQNGNEDDLNDAIQLHRDALALCPSGHPDRRSSLNNLAVSLQTRFEQTGNMDDLDEAVRLHRDALALLPEGHPDRSGYLSNLASSLRMRFEQTGNMDDLDEAVRFHRDAFALRPEGHPDRSASLNNLATSLQTRCEQTGNTDDLDEAVRLFRDALALRPEGHPGRSSSMFNISGALHARFKKLGYAEDFEECIQLLMGAAAHTFSPTLIRLNAARRWSTFARRRDHDTTLDAYRTAISLLQLSLTVRPSLPDRHEALTSEQEYRTLGIDAASYAIEKGDFGAAVELLEQGRALLWSQLRGLRSPLDRLSAVDKGLADRFAVCCRQLEGLMTSSDSDRSVLDSSGGGVHGPKDPKGRNIRDEMLERVRKLTAEQEAIINETRLVPGFEDFLRGASFDMLRQVASEGPAIVLNHSRFRCDALIILSREVDSCVCVPLDDSWSSDALHLCNDLVRARYERKVHSLEYDETLRRAMKVVWDRVVSKVVQKLEELGVAKGSRIWWCSTLCLPLLPFHAAGPYMDTGGVTKYLLDDYISSYTPTLTSLIAARSGIRIRSEKLLFVGDTSLKATKKEFANICKHRRVWRRLLDKDACRDSVLKALRKAEWVHFSCHGKLDAKPFESSFALPGGNLTLLDIAGANLPNAEFAFLSACHTAEQAPSPAMDEALHLAAAIQFCGFRSVVGTMWQLLDRDGPILADAVYMHLMDDISEGEARFKRAADAVRKAAIHLRESQKEWGDGGTVVDIMAERWVNLVHFGA